MEQLFFAKGLLLGFSIAAPVGPIGILCIRRTLANGITSGLASGLGAACTDAVYGCIAALGLTAAAVFLADHQTLLRFGGGLFLVYLGSTILRSRPSLLVLKTGRLGLLQDFASTLLLTMANPLTIMSFAAVFAGLGGGAAGDYTAPLLMTAGVFCGSMLWWVILCKLAACFRAKLEQGRLAGVNRLSGCIIIGFGILSILSV